MTNNHQSDQYLIEQYQAGNKSTLVVLVKRWHRIFCEKAFWVLRDKDLSKDVAQESWIIIIDKLQTLRNTKSFKSWALRIIYTKAIDAHKRRAKELQNLKKVNQNDFLKSHETDDEVDLKKKLSIGIRSLSKDKQDVIRLFYIEEYTLKEISSFLEIPLGTVKSRLFKAREKLKSIIS